MALLTLVAATPTANAKRSIMELPLFERAVLIIKKFETLHKPKHWPTICYGHVVQRGEHFTRRQYSESEADASCIRNMDVTNIFLRLSLITLAPEPSIKAAFWKSWNAATATSSSPIPPTAITKASGTPAFTKGGLRSLQFFTHHKICRDAIHWNKIASRHLYSLSIPVI